MKREHVAWKDLTPLFCSYKQYDYLQGLDVVQIAGIDSNQLAQDVLNSGTINEQEGWIAGFDPTILQTAQTQAQTALEDYITNNMTNPTVGDVIGGRKTIVEQYPTLAASLPNKIITTGTRYDKLPASLQQSVRYSFDQNSISAPLAWSTLNNEKVTLSFTPATPDDEAALQSLLPEGQITDISQLPTGIPAYLIKVIPELKVNGITKLTGNPMKLGKGLDFNTQIKQPGRSSNINYTYNIPAGSFVSVNTITGNVSAKKLTDLQTQLTQTKTTLESNDPVQVQNLTREEILGDMFYAGTLGYFAQLIGLSSIAALQAEEQFYLSAGYGTFGYEPRVGYFFGIPKTIEAGGVTLDIPTLLVTANNAGDTEKDKQFMIQSGVLLSTLEHATPEQMFYTDPNNPPNAFSAVKALQIASAQGQKIYQITQANISSVMPNLNLDAAAETEILQAVSTGKEVVAHTDPVSVPGYTGAGYIILDSITGEGAYRISGGKNGGAGKMAAQSISKVFEFRLLMSAVVDSALGGTGQSSYGGPVLGALLTVLSTFVTIIDIFESCNDPFVLFALTIFVLSITTAVAIFFSQLGALAPSVAALSPVSIIGLATIFSIGISKSVEKLRGVGGC